jgi:hypothetical protein
MGILGLLPDARGYHVIAVSPCERSRDMLTSKSTGETELRLFLFLFE